MRRYCLMLTVHCLLAAGTAAAAPALLRWQTDVARPQPRDWEVFQGETVVLAPVMTEGGAGVDLSRSTCALWYQTNGMAGAWWSVPAATGTVAGEVRATWSPTNDCGAARYNYFIAAASPAGTMYRAHGRLVMRHAPGAAPSILAAPTTLTDAMQAWADARYDPIGAAQTASNALAAAMTNWQAIVYGMTNGAALGETALQPDATNTLAAAAAHAGTAHKVTDDGGFQAGFGANATYGGSVGAGAIAAEGGAVGYSANAYDGGAVGVGARTSNGFAGGKAAYATSDGTFYGEPIDAIQLGSGGNTEPFTLQIYSTRLLNADGTIPLDRMSLHTADENAHADIRAAIDAIPLPPTNAVAGWLVWDTGSNCYWQVTATNLRFYVWGVAE